jgi:FtsH-binding integral membrane protein
VKPGLVAVVDLVCVLAFAGIGRASHGESVGPVGLVTTAWPFLAGGLVGWVLVLVVRAARGRPVGLAAGVLVWLPTVVVGMLLRALTEAGVQTSFVIVATVVLGLFLLGWRAIARLVRRSRGSRNEARTEVQV